MSLRARLLTARLAAFAVGAVVLWLSLTPNPPSVSRLPAGADLVVHFLMHGGLGGWLGIGWTAGVARAVAAVCALSFEAGQALVPGRTMSLFDLGANAMGAILGLWVGGWVRRRFLPGADAL